jgi:hypothetical protein
MIRWKELLTLSSHPSNDDLTSYIDNELSPGLGNKIRNHLGSCWCCRARREELEQSIVRVVAAVNAYFGDSASLSAAARTSFKAKLGRLAAEKNENSPLFSLFGSLRSTVLPRFSIGQAVAALCCTVFVVCIIRLGSTEPLTAGGLLQRSKYAEQEYIHKVPNPAIHQRIKVYRKTAHSAGQESMTWEIWNDMVNDRMKEKVEDEEGAALPDGEKPPTRGHPLVPAPPSPLLLELKHIYSASGMDVRCPLSPRNYENWRRSLTRKREEVTEADLLSGERGMVLKTTAEDATSESPIISAELIVRTRDWHPIEQRFTVQEPGGAQEYDLVETTFQVVALNSLPRTIFDEKAQTAHLRRLPPVLRLTPSSEDLEETEIAVEFALHRLNECLDGQVQVGRDSLGSVKVDGLVENDQRKQELTKALSIIPFTVIKIQTLEEAAAEGEPFATSPGTRSTPLLRPETAERSNEIQRNKLWIESQLERYAQQFQLADPRERDRRIVQISNEAIADADAALRQAWALRRLAQNFPPERVKHFRTSSRMLLATMVGDHTSLLEGDIDRLKALVDPVLSSFALSGIAPKNSNQENETTRVPAVGSSWQDRALRLFSKTDEIDLQTLGIFSNAASLQGDAAEAASELLKSFPQFQENAQGFRGEFDSYFSCAGGSPAPKNPIN